MLTCVISVLLTLSHLYLNNNYKYVYMISVCSMEMICYTVVLFWLLLLYIANCEGVIYTVKPDEPPNIICHNCKHLSDLNHQRYFASNSQLYFLPGIHYISNSLVISDVHNISLIGNSSTDTVIYCQHNWWGKTGINMSNITNLTVKNLLIYNCKATIFGYRNKISFNKFHVSLAILNSNNISVHHVTLGENKRGGRLLLVNALGKSILANVVSSELEVIYVDSDNSAKDHNHMLIIFQYKAIFYEYYTTPEEEDPPYRFVRNSDDNNYDLYDRYAFFYDNYFDMYRFQNDLIPHYLYLIYYEDNGYGNPDKIEEVKTIPAISLILLQSSYGVKVKFVDITFSSLHYYEVLTIMSNNCGRHKNTIIIENCTFSDNIYERLHRPLASMVRILLSTYMTKTDKIQFAGNNIIEFYQCSFIHNFYKGSLISILWKHKNCSQNGTANQVRKQIVIANCSFRQNVFSHLIEFISTKNVVVIAIFRSTEFKQLYEKVIKSDFITDRPAIFAFNVPMLMEGPISFTTVDITKSLMHTNTKITIVDNINFLNIIAKCLVSGQKYSHINLVSNVYINISNISIQASAFAVDYKHDNNFYSSCFFQYYQSETKNDMPVYNVVIADNKNNNIFDFHTGNVNCKLTQGSLYHGMNPLTVHQQHFQITNKTGAYPLFNTGLLCYCLDKLQSNCFTNTLGPIYPGQNIGIYLTLNPSVTDSDALPISVKIYVEDILATSICKVSSLLQAEQLITKNCKQVNFILF